MLRQAKQKGPSSMYDKTKSQYLTFRASFDSLFLLFSHIRSSGFTDDRDFDIARIIQIIFDFFANIVG